MIFDHVDLRVTVVDRVRTFYDAFLRPFGFRGRPQEDGTLVYFRLENRRVREAIAIIGDELHRPNATRLAFSAASLALNRGEEARRRFHAGIAAEGTIVAK